MDEEDHKDLEAVRQFNPYDLYSKSDGESSAFFSLRGKVAFADFRSLFLPSRTSQSRGAQALLPRIDQEVLP